MLWRESWGKQKTETEARYALNRERDGKQQAAYQEQVESILPALRDPSGISKFDAKADERARLQGEEEARAKDLLNKTGIVL